VRFWQLLCRPSVTSNAAQRNIIIRYRILFMERNRAKRSMLVLRCFIILVCVNGE